MGKLITLALSTLILLACVDMTASHPSGGDLLGRKLPLKQYYFWPHRLDRRHYQTAEENSLYEGRRKKRIGIAGLDNMDVITSVLEKGKNRARDRSRSRSGKMPRPPMSISLSVGDIRRLLSCGRRK